MNDPLGKPLVPGARVVYGVAFGGGGAVTLYHGLVKEVHGGARPWIKVDVESDSFRKRKYARLYSVERVYVVDPPKKTGAETLNVP